jgi:hypothetical protein
MPHTQIQIRRGSAAFWDSENPILHDGEPGYERDTRRLKIGDGITHWRELPYSPTGATSGGGGTTDEDTPDLVLFYNNGKV